MTPDGNEGLYIQERAVRVCRRALGEGKVGAGKGNGTRGRFEWHFGGF